MRGARTGKYRAGGEELLVNSAGQSEISYADYAIAIVDEIENGEHIKERFYRCRRVRTIYPQGKEYNMKKPLIFIL